MRALVWKRERHVAVEVDDLLPLVLDDADPLGTEGFATHHLPLDQAPKAYGDFASKSDDMVKVLLQPGQHGPLTACTC